MLGSVLGPNAVLTLRNKRTYPRWSWPEGSARLRADRKSGLGTDLEAGRDGGPYKPCNSPPLAPCLRLCLSVRYDKTFLVGSGHTSAWSCKLSVTAFAVIMGSLARTHDHAGAVPIRRDMLARRDQDPRNTRTSARQVKRQASAL